MDKRSLVLVTITTFLAFLVLLSAGMSLSTQDDVRTLEGRVDDVEYSVARLRND